MTSCYRRHLQGYHEEEWSEGCKSENLKPSQSLPSKGTKQAPFTVEGFHHLLLKWIAVDDQVCQSCKSCCCLGTTNNNKSINVLECPEFRELLLYIGENKLDEDDLPHRTKATIMILEEYKKKHMKVVNDIQVSGY